MWLTANIYHWTVNSNEGDSVNVNCKWAIGNEEEKWQTLCFLKSWVAPQEKLTGLHCFRSDICHFLLYDVSSTIWKFIKNTILYTDVYYYTVILPLGMLIRETIAHVHNDMHMILVITVLFVEMNVWKSINRRKLMNGKLNSDCNLSNITSAWCLIWFYCIPYMQ